MRGAYIGCHFGRMGNSGHVGSDCWGDGCRTAVEVVPIRKGDEVRDDGQAGAGTGSGIGASGEGGHWLCAQVRLAASAHLDGADGPVTAAVVALHVADCSDCRVRVAALGEVTRRLRVSGALAVPDLTEAIVAAVARDRVATRLRQRRWLVALAGVMLAVAAVSGVVTAGASPPGHAIRDVAALETALAAALGLAAWRPSVHAPAVWGIVAVVGVLGLAVAGVDVASGRASVWSETGHLIPLVAVWALLPWVDLRGVRRGAVVG